MLAYLDGEPFGWVAVEPRANYRRLRGSTIYGVLTAESHGTLRLMCATRP